MKSFVLFYSVELNWYGILVKGELWVSGESEFQSRGPMTEKALLPSDDRTYGDYSFFSTYLLPLILSIIPSLLVFKIGSVLMVCLLHGSHLISHFALRLS